MLGVSGSQSNVSEDAPMDPRKDKSGLFRLYQVLAYPVVKKGSSAAAASE
jgi:hypothetical protein